MGTDRLIRRAAPAVVCLFVAACGGSGSSSSSTAASTSTTTAPAATTTVGAPDDETTTTAPESQADPDALAEAKVRAALAMLPDTWQGSVASDLGEEGAGDDIVFAPCLGPDDYDLDNLDADSAASWELDAEGPSTGSPIGGQQATVEARVFAEGADVDSAFAVLEYVLGTDEGRACLAAEVPGQLAAGAPPDAEFDASVEGPAVEGAQVGARLVVGFNAGGISGEFYIDLVASRVDERCTVFATFMGFGEPVDPAVASAMFDAAVTAEL